MENGSTLSNMVHNLQHLNFSLPGVPYELATTLAAMSFVNVDI
jgi:hypothetical protein